MSGEFVPFPVFTADAAVNTLYGLVLGTVDVGAQLIHRDAAPGTTTVPLIALLVVTSEGEPILIDSGFDTSIIPRIPTAHTLDAKGVEAALQKHGYELSDIRVAVNTHLHADHAGMNSHLPNARIFVQEAEYAYAMAPPEEHRRAYRPRSSFWGIPVERFEFVNGHYELRPGLWLLHTPGHTPGHQAVAIHTERGWIVFTGDACDDARIWNGEESPGIVLDQELYDSSLQAMRDSGCIPLYSHDLEFTRTTLPTIAHV